MRIRKACSFALLLLTLAVPVQAQDQLDRDPGYMDLETIDTWFGREATIEVNIKGALLNLIAEASRHEDPELAGLLGKLKAIQVRAYPLDFSDLERVDRQAGDYARRLEQSGWDTVVRVREEDERVHMFTKVRGNVIAGLVVMVISAGEDETVFVNIVGDIDPAQIGRIGQKFDIGPLRDHVVGRIDD